MFLAERQWRAHAGSRVEAGNAGAGAAHALCQRALRDDFQLHAIVDEIFDQRSAFQAGIRTHQLADALVAQQQHHAALGHFGVVGNKGEIACAMGMQGFQQFIGKAATGETSAQDDCAVVDAVHSICSRWQDLVDHCCSAFSIWREHARKLQVVI